MSLPAPTLLDTGEVEPAVFRRGGRRRGPPVQLHGHPDDAGSWGATAEALAPPLDRHEREAGHWLALSHPQWLAPRVRELIANGGDAAATRAAGA